MYYEPTLGMFNILSTCISWLINPLHLGMLLLGIALGLRLLKRAPRARRRLIIVACVEMWVMSLRLVSEPLVWGLEHNYDPAPQLEKEPGAIVVLCGFTRIPERGEYELTEAADRLVEGVRLAHLHPKAVLVISGAYIDNYGSRYAESKILRKLVLDLGIEPERLRMDGVSRNTHENAIESKKLVEGIEGPIVLVTSAMHMPRAKRSFDKVGLETVPWPVDYRLKGLGLRGLFPGVDDMSTSNDSLREYFGLLGYKAAGYI